MANPDTTLTDFGLALLCLGFALSLPGTGELRMLYGLLFAALGAAALGGALYHGRFDGLHHGVGGALWIFVLIAVGIANTALWGLAGWLTGLSGLNWIAAIQLGLYLAVIAVWTQAFLVASAFSLPPSLVLLAVFLIRFQGDGGNGFLLGCVALAVAFAGAALQAARVGLPALGLGHNGLYHLIQAAAFTLLFVARPGL